MPTPLPFRLRALTAAASFAFERGWLPTPRALLDTPHDARLRRKSMRIACRPGDPSIRTEDHQVQGRGGPIHARVYTRPDTRPGAPAILFIHGGGFVDGGVDFCDNVQRGLAARTGCVVVGLSYRLAPEHPFPAGLEDCQDVLCWLAESTPAGLDPTRIAVGGESAGGNLTVALALASRDAGGPAIAHLSIYYPFTDTTLRSADWDTSDMPGVGRAEGEFMVKVYAPNDASHPLVSVLHAKLAGLPPSTVITCGHDPLRSDGIWLAEALRAAGVRTLHTHYDDMPHGFLMFSRLTRRADESLDEMARETAKAFASSSERRTRREALVLEHMSSENVQEWERTMKTFSHARYELPDGRVIDGHDDVMRYWLEGRAVVPDQRNELIALTHLDDVHVQIEFWLRGTPKPSGQPFEVRLWAVYDFDGDDLMTNERVYTQAPTADQIAGRVTPDGRRPAGP
ncbi:MAG TPA: alpha/beta hydrolase fold domain-containing protein [Myxococcota bacterium]|nr:alpha/beta hydrolase fold domain-containing protein [Myxococcota bacterium]